MKKKSTTVILLFVQLLGLHQIFAQTYSANDNLVAQPITDRTVTFDYFGAGEAKPMIWGMDAGGWTSYAIWELGKRYLGVENIKTTRIPAFPGDILVNGNELTQGQKDAILDRVKQAETGSNGNPMQIMLNPGGVDEWDAWYREDWSRYAMLMKLAKDYIESFGHTVVSITGFNEPDVWYAAATMEDNYNLFQACDNSGYFEGVRFCGGNTLDCDLALDWYNHDLDFVTEGNTHQLAGWFNQYATFHETLKANGHYSTNDEVHNIMEAIVGSEYGDMHTGIFWGWANLARGEFVKASSNGVRLAYAEHRDNWSAAAVYRQADEKVQAFVGSSERQAVATSYRFFSKNGPVYFEGHGPQYEFILDQPGGNGYGVDQPNAERVINITQGDDIQPVIDGTYKLINRSNGKVMQVANNTDGANVYLGANTGSTNQQWQIIPLLDWTFGNDANYYQIVPVLGTTKCLDLNNYSHDNGGNIHIWGNGGSSNQQWYLEYAEDGYFYIRSRESTYCLQTTVLGNVEQWQKTGDAKQQWRFIPTDASAEFDAPAAISDLKATASEAFIQLDWSASAEEDVTEYTILRSETSGSAYNTIARHVTSTTFIDNSATSGGPYYYVIKAVDYSLNSSAFSNEVSASPTGNNAMIAHYDFEDDLLDGTENLNNCAAFGEAVFESGKVDSKALSFDGTDAFVQLPATIANQSEITIATWAYWNGGQAWQRIFDFGNGIDQYMFLTPTTNTGKLRFGIKNGGDEQVLETTKLDAQEWTHVAVTIDATGAKLYVNGELAKESASITINPLDFKPVLNYVGRSQFSDPLYTGMIDDFKVYNYALSASEITTLAETLTNGIFKSSYNDGRNLSIYPVPAKDNIVITYTGEYVPVSYISVYDMNGKLILSETMEAGNDVELNVSDLQSGIYMLKLTNDNETIIKKMLVKH